MLSQMTVEPKRHFPGNQKVCISPWASSFSSISYTFSQLVLAYVSVSHPRKAFPFKPSHPKLPCISQLTLRPHPRRLHSAFGMHPILAAKIPSTRRSEDRPWISTHSIKNALHRNHFVDFLQVHGPRAGFTRDDEAFAFDESANAAIRTARLTREFQCQVIGAFVRRAGQASCVSPITTKQFTEELRTLTVQLITERKPLIVGAILADVEHRIWARVPVLIRCDVAQELFPVVKIKASACLEDTYVAIGVKRSSVVTTERGFLKRKFLRNMQIEMWLWNRLLTALQGVDVGKALLVGLNPNRKKSVAMGAWPKQEGSVGIEGLFDTDVWKLAQVEFGGAQCPKGIAAIQSLAWRVLVVDKGEEWIRAVDTNLNAGGETEDNERDRFLRVVQSTKDVRLRPNMKVDSFHDFPWAKAKYEVAEIVKELTLLSRVGVNVTEQSMANGLPNDFENPTIDAEALGIDASSTKKLLEMCKPTYEGGLVYPAVIPHNYCNWRRLQGFKGNIPHIFNKASPLIPYADERTFYVDLELASPDMLYTNIAQDGNQAESARFYDEHPIMPLEEQSPRGSLIFMIGCGQVINGEWRHRAFVASSLSKEGERAVIQEWLEHMNSLNPDNCGPPLLHVWGPEQHLLKTAMKSMTRGDTESLKAIRSYRVINIQQVVQKGSVTIKGCFKNSLKSVATSLEQYELLEDFNGRGDEDSVCNGGDAMALGLSCAEYAERNSLKLLSQVPRMEQIVKYNEADCRDIARIVKYLRDNH